MEKFQDLKIFYMRKCCHASKRYLFKERRETSFFLFINQKLKRSRRFLLVLGLSTIAFVLVCLLVILSVVILSKKSISILKIYFFVSGKFFYELKIPIDSDKY